MRADLAVAKALNISRNKASELIKASKIKADDLIILKPCQNISSEAKISCDDEIFVSRGAIKLKAFLEFLKNNKPEIAPNLANKCALDIGSSTGGFTQILLENGVCSVDCVDVGSSLLADIIKNDKRVKAHENTDIREFAKSCQQRFALITADVSFIALSYIIPSINQLANDDIIILFKPQFEVGKDAKRSKKGVVNDALKITKAKGAFKEQARELGWVLLCEQECAISGKNGNQEIFFYYKKG